MRGWLCDRCRLRAWRPGTGHYLWGAGRAPLAIDPCIGRDVGPHRVRSVPVP